MDEYTDAIGRELTGLVKKKTVAMLEGIGYFANNNLSEEEKRERVQSAHNAEREAEIELRAMEKMARLLGYDVIVSLNPAPEGEPGIYIDGVRHWYKPFDEDGVVEDARNFRNLSFSEIFGLNDD